MDFNFDEVYGSSDFYWGDKPSRSVVAFLKYLNKGLVLDLGAGEGRNSLFLARQGFDVVGVDVSSKGIEKFLSLAKRQNLNVEGRVVDAREFEFDREYDVIICDSLFHFLNRVEIIGIMGNMKKFTKKGGLNVVSVFNIDNPDKGFSYLFKRNELKSLYNDWEILFYYEFVTRLERHGEGQLHRHAVSEIITRK